MPLAAGQNQILKLCFTKELTAEHQKNQCKEISVNSRYSQFEIVTTSVRPASEAEEAAWAAVLR